MSPDQLVSDVIEKYSEWLEMSDDASNMLIDILASLLIKEIELKEHYKKVAHACNDSKHSRMA